MASGCGGNPTTKLAGSAVGCDTGLAAPTTWVPKPDRRRVAMYADELPLRLSQHSQRRRRVTH